MKPRLFAAILVALILATGVFAKSFSFVACTHDHYTATLAVEFIDSAPQAQVERVGVAFGAAANTLDAADLIQAVGYQLFVGQLMDDDRDSFLLDGPPAISESAACKAK
jgi:hypothetical protein